MPRKVLIWEAEARGWGCLCVTVDNIKVFHGGAEMCPSADRDFRGPAATQPFPLPPLPSPVKSSFRHDDSLTVKFVIGGTKRNVGYSMPVAYVCHSSLYSSF